MCSLLAVSEKVAGIRYLNVSHCDSLLCYTCTGRKRNEFGWSIGHAININIEEGRRDVLKECMEFLYFENWCLLIRCGI